MRNKCMTKLCGKDRADRKERLKTYNDYIKEAQKEFNHYVRVRDKNKPCISCGTEQMSAKRGGLLMLGIIAVEVQAQPIDFICSIA